MSKESGFIVLEYMPFLGGLGRPGLSLAPLEEPGLGILVLGICEF